MRPNPFLGASMGVSAFGALHPYFQVSLAEYGRTCLCLGIVCLTASRIALDAGYPSQASILWVYSPILLTAWPFVEQPSTPLPANTPFHSSQPRPVEPWLAFRGIYVQSSLQPLAQVCFLLARALKLLTSRAEGRTAPSLIEDTNLRDIQTASPGDVNILKDHPISWATTNTIADILPSGSCLHRFCTKERQSQHPGLDTRPDQSSVYYLAAICRLCRTHLSATCDYTKRPGTSACPNDSSPLHHLVYSAWRVDVATKEEHSQNKSDSTSWKGETYVFECSSKTCSAVVSIRLHTPRFSPQMVKILTDQVLLKTRTDASFRLAAERLEGSKRPSVTEVLTDLRQYLRNAWIGETKPIRVDNKRFMLRFGPGGEACKELLEFMGFTFEVSYLALTWLGIRLS